MIRSEAIFQRPAAADSLPRPRSHAFPWARGRDILFTRTLYLRRHHRDDEIAGCKIVVAIVIFLRVPFGDLLTMRFEEYRKHDAVSLAELIAKREVSAKEVLETAIARAEQVNPAINAIVHKQYDQARRAISAGLPEGPLKGVPTSSRTLVFSSRVSRQPSEAGYSRILSPITRQPM